ncbi:hypothetical protein VOLCADRAFT_100760 [Volvox carteri f. nagariensis]|uniref:Uncharacterized protein n=1 Tax=Volvox carteri f. nagariensis TaxID=3068 RepID=D8UKY8_VOLCA|nr:uncharacterized protein VOLCADRAFT_100760 [Volvox carteri f. nagariensis]EFJ39614.1 hypothetical protein VOLCADRAFT_100760 [Volvox carteri f. nagariensis]|eukprot:XP_002959321.1 hypothetical protein VOLCADRAFT_100760 [Volvox carteri f. nagariensis]
MRTPRPAAQRPALKSREHGLDTYVRKIHGRAKFDRELKRLDYHAQNVKPLAGRVKGLNIRLLGLLSAAFISSGHGQCTPHCRQDCGVHTTILRHAPLHGEPLSPPYGSSWPRSLWSPYEAAMAAASCFTRNPG